MEDLAPSTINVRLSVVARKLVNEAKRNGWVPAEAAVAMTDIRQQETRLRNWLTKEQARGLLAVPIARP